jgi:hypothetical protein
MPRHHAATGSRARTAAITAIAAATATAAIRATAVLRTVPAASVSSPAVSQRLLTSATRAHTASAQIARADMNNRERQ